MFSEKKHLTLSKQKMLSAQSYSSDPIEYFYSIKGADNCLADLRPRWNLLSASKDNLVSRDKRRAVFFAIALAILGTYKKRGTLLILDFNSFRQMRCIFQFFLYISQYYILLYIYYCLFTYIELLYQYINTPFILNDIYQA